MKRFISGLIIAALCAPMSGCYSRSYKMVDEPVYGPKKVQRKAKRSVFVPLFVNLSKRAGIEVEIADKLGFYLRKDFLAYSQAYQMVPRSAVHNGTAQVTYELVPQHAAPQEVTWALSGIITEGSRPGTLVVTANVFPPGSNNLVERITTEGSPDTIVAAIVSRLRDEDRKSELKVWEDTGEQVQTGTEQVSKEVTELNVPATIVVVLGLVASVAVSAFLVFKR